MSQSRPASTVTRRRFLKAVGLVTGAVAVTGFTRPRTAAAAAPLAVDYPVRIGLLVPEAGVLSANLAEGLRLGLKSAGASQMQVAPTTAGGFAADGVDLLVGVAGPGLADRLSGALATAHTVFIGTEAGANVIRPSDQYSAIYYNSLDYWRCSWALGDWAARHIGKRACLVGSFRDSGYDAFAACHLGFESAGGAIVGSQITHSPMGEWNWESVMDAISAAEPDCVFALYSGQAGAEFVRAYAAAGLAGRIPLLGSAFLVDEALLPDLGDAALGIRSCSTWAPGLQTPENQAFMAAFRAAAGREPDAYAVLGYETAQLVVSALQAAGGNARSAVFRQALGAVQFAGPRGRLAMSARAQDSATPIYLREVKATDAGPVNAVVGALSPVPEDAARTAPLRTGLRSGWATPYLF